jgi:hypothetical protein
MMNRKQKSHLRLGLADLRSGKYPQDKGRLRTDQGFCCLGVFCDRYRKETGNGKWVQHLVTNSWIFRIDNRDEGSILPSDVAEWYGLDSNPPMPFTEVAQEWPFPPREIRSAAEYNDSNIPFLKIADVMEEKYLGKKQ